MHHKEGEKGGLGKILLWGAGGYIAYRLLTGDSDEEQDTEDEDEREEWEEWEEWEEGDDEDEWDWEDPAVEEMKRQLADVQRHAELPETAEEEDALDDALQTAREYQQTVVETMDRVG